MTEGEGKGGQGRRGREERKCAVPPPTFEKFNH